MKERRRDVAVVLAGLIAKGVPIVYIDEYHAAPGAGRAYAWAPKGEESYTLSLPKSKGWHLAAAITDSKLIHLHIQQAPFTGEHFASFVSDVQAAVADDPTITAASAILFFDNAAIHRCKKVSTHIEALKVRALANCPYSPELNMAELFIREHKKLLKVAQR
jgi:hypothetical protein